MPREALEIPLNKGILTLLAPSGHMGNSEETAIKYLFNGQAAMADQIHSEYLQAKGGEKE